MRTLFEVSRPISWINTAFPFGAAYVLAGGPLGLDLWLGCLFFLIPYNLVMYGVNDVFDYASDVHNPRKGGVEGALVDPARHRFILTSAAVSALPFVAYFLIRSAIIGLDQGNWWALGVFALSMFAVVAYSVAGLRFKEVPFLDSLTSSTHFSSPAWFGLALVGATPTAEVVLILVAFFLWGCASHAFGAVQDVVPDREGGLASIATVLGARATVRLAVALYVVAGGLVLFTPFPVCLGALLAVPYIANTGRFWQITDTTSGAANAGWKLFIPLNYGVGFLVTMLMIWSSMVRA